MTLNVGGEEGYEVGTVRIHDRASISYGKSGSDGTSLRVRDVPPELSDSEGLYLRLI